MRDTFYRWAGRLRGKLQRLPGIGAARATVSLTSSPRPAALVESIPIYAAHTVESRGDRAQPPTISHSFPDKTAHLLQNVTLWPHTGAAVDNCARIVEESGYSPRRLWWLRETGTFRRFPPREFSGTVTTLHIGPRWDNYYHRLIDSFSRIAALHAPGIAELGPVKLLVCDDARDDYLRLITALLPPQVELVTLPARSRVRADRYLLLPFLAQEKAGYLPPDFPALLQARAFAAFGVRPDPSRRRRILISRRSTQHRRVTNEVELAAALRPFGFELIELEQLTFAAQMQTFAEAEYVVGAHGAGLTNLLFAPPCRVLELFPGRPRTHYRWLATALGQEYANLSAGPTDSKVVDFDAPIEAVLEVLRHGGIASRV